MLFWVGFIVGGIAVGTVVAIVAMMYIVIGGLTRAGENKARWGELWRQWMGAQWEGAEPRKEARRQLAIKREMARLEEQGH